MHWQGKKMARLSLLLAVAVLLGYVEAVIPVSVGVPGVKLGLANCALLFVLYAFGPAEAALVSVLRTLIIALLFTNLPMLIYSLSGALMSILLMSLIKRGPFSIYGVSAAGGMTHNLTQLLAALIVAGLTGSTPSFLLTYASLLILCGMVAGFVNAFLASVLLQRISPEALSGN
ncbi:MAG: Gx transporter family protein [Lachnospiraceae bacterium]|nr:Gx transporter family protein [Lachnospiraceae bacterium]